MTDLHVNTNPKFELIFKNYPDSVRDKMYELHSLIQETAKKIEEITQLEETLKWGEPSYLTKYGSTLRIHWKPKSPHQYAMYFQCSSRLVSTFKLVFPNTFKFEGNRAILFELKDEIPTEKLKHCIKAALMYHKVKHLPALGI